MVTEQDRLGDLKVGVIGGGVVGQATARSWLEYAAEVGVWDIDEKRATVSAAWNLYECDLLYLCLPTNPGEDGTLDTSLLETAVRQLGEWVAREQVDPERLPMVLVKSTVPLDTTNELCRIFHEASGTVDGTILICHQPEFLTARCAIHDANIPTQTPIGVAVTDNDDSTRARLELADMLADILLARFGTPALVTVARNTEMAKLCANTFFAAKVAIFNAFRQLAVADIDALPADQQQREWEGVRAILMADGRIAPNHTRVPGPDGELGYGGACLPKDLGQLAREFADLELYGAANLFQAVADLNEALRK
ncbi:MAG: hypothetical protein ACPG75_04195 [Alloalcanivorax venustensis]